MIFKYFILTASVAVLSYYLLHGFDLEFGVLLNRMSKCCTSIFNVENFNFGNDPVTRSEVSPENEKLFTAEELSVFNGVQSSLIYLSIIGNVFDVSKGKNFYGPKETYNGFSGRDASKAFITGDFTPSGLTDDIASLTNDDLLSLDKWMNKYKQDYIYKGKLIGRFYSTAGEPTDYLKMIEDRISNAKIEAEKSNELKKEYPPCNVEWSKDEGSTVWCSKQSGGISRDWVGVPRKLFSPGQKKPTCVCIQLESEKAKLANLEEYENCQAESYFCKLKE